MRQLAIGLILSLCAVLTSGPVLAQENVRVRQVFLVQNSGWMEPFYRDSRSRFREMVARLVRNSSRADTDIILASFNQDGQVAGKRSPEVLFSGRYEDSQIARAVAAIDLQKKENGSYADSDFNGALKATISGLLKGREGLIWMVTNAKDSPDNSKTVVANTQQFYGQLRKSPYITRLAAFPIRDELSGPNFSEKGFIIYAIAYGESAGRALDGILAEGSAVRKMFRFPPVKIKPLDRDPVAFQLTGASQGARIENGILLLEQQDGSKPVAIRLQGQLRSKYYPQNIEFAVIKTSWKSEDREVAGSTIAVSPGRVGRIDALQPSQPISFTVTLPPTTRRGPFFGLLDNHRTVGAELAIRLDDLRFSMDRAFIERISAIGGSQTAGQNEAEAELVRQLPSVFFDYREVGSATTRIPVSIVIQRSVWPLILTFTLIAAFVLLIAVLAIWAARARTYPIPVGGATMSVSIRPFEQRIVADPFGVRANVRGSLLGPPRVKTIAEHRKAIKD